MKIFHKKCGGTGFLRPSCGVILIVFAAIALNGSHALGKSYQCGDPNDDGNVNIGDAVTIIDYIFRGSGLPPQPDAADANCNGAIDVGDAVSLINHVFSGGPAPCSDCPPIGQYILFEVCYSNFAWAPTLKGFYVNNNGQVITYEYDYDQVTWPAPQWHEEYTEWELMYRYNHNPRLCQTIPDYQLNVMYQLVEPASEGPISDTVFRCFDFGEIYSVAYIFDADNGVYQPVLLELAGDFAQKNFSPEAEQLVEWLMICGYDEFPCRY